MDYSNQNMMNLLTSKIFHDIGNIASFLNFYIELNRDNSKNANFDELVDINKRMISQLKLLKCTFLDNAYGENGLTTLKEYYSCKGVSIEFKVDSFTFTSGHLQLIANILMILEGILSDGSSIEILHEESNLEIKCTSAKDFTIHKITIFDDLKKLDNINIFYINNALNNIDCKLCYSIISARELVFNIK